MIYSRKLLEKFLPGLTSKTDQELINACGQIGTEIEHIYKHPITNDLIIGKILSHKKHPNADKLNVCEVQIDKNGKTNTIVCGAANVTDNKFVIVALEGAKLPDGRIIEYKDLRGIKSEGMLCAYTELTPYSEFLPSSETHNIILLEEAEIGDTNIAKYVGLDDTIYDIAVPFSNRPDFNGVLSLCQELSGFFKLNFKFPKVNISELDTKKISVKYNRNEIEAFTIAKISNVDCKKQSTWEFKGLLMNNGFKPINDVLDRLNYITLLTNCASAAYDCQYVDEFVIEFAKPDTIFNGFDGKQHHLTKNDFIIKSHDDIICLAGIMGENKSGVKDETKDIYVEFANFNYAKIRQTAQRLNIKTDAAKRLSKPLSNMSVLYAHSLIKEIFKDNETESLFVFFNQNKIGTIDLDLELTNQILGSNFNLEQITEKLLDYGFEQLNNSFVPPVYRTDVSTTQDLIEEVTKTLKVNDIDEQAIDIAGDSKNDKCEYTLISKIKDILINNYFNEVKTYNTINKSLLENFNVFDYKDHVKIVSSSNQNREYLRSNLIESMLKVYEFNNSYKNKLIPIFEIQKIYAVNPSVTNLTLLSEENYWIDKANNSKITFNILGLKGVLSEITQYFNTNLEFKVFKDSKAFYENECVSIYHNNKMIGYIGCIKKSKLPFKINEKKIYCATINLNDIIASFNGKKISYKTYDTLLPIIKDISVIINEESSLSEVLKKINELEFVEKYEIIDKFVKENKISYTIRFFIKNKIKIEQSEINECFNKIVDKFKEYKLM